jgi:hypothetical protein
VEIRVTHLTRQVQLSVSIIFFIFSSLGSVLLLMPKTMMVASSRAAAP